MAEWLEGNWIDIVVPIVCVLLTWLLTMHHERKGKQSDTNKDLQLQIESLKEKLAVYEDVEQSQSGDFFILKNSGRKICPICWSADHVPIPVFENNDTGYYICAKCEKSGVFDHVKVRRIAVEQSAAQEKLFECMSQFNQERNPFF